MRFCVRLVLEFRRKRFRKIDILNNTDKSENFVFKHDSTLFGGYSQIQPRARIRLNYYNLYKENDYVRSKYDASHALTVITDYKSYCYSMFLHEQPLKSVLLE